MVNLDKVIKSISFALDLSQMSLNLEQCIIEKVSNLKYSDHRFLHHSLRANYISFLLGIELKLNLHDLEELYISSFLHDIGVSNFLNESHLEENFIIGHCISGANITNCFPIFNNISKYILYHHENFNGSGPFKIKDNDIPIQSQIIRIADLVEILYEEDIPSYAQKNSILKWIKDKENIIFSPNITNAFFKISNADIFWLEIENISYSNFQLSRNSPISKYNLTLQEFLDIAHIFSKIIDNKCSFTGKHSLEISNLTYHVAKYLSFSEDKCIKMKIAGLLHDVGKLAIPKNILNKNNNLTSDEFSMIKSHAYYTYIILNRIGNIDDISKWASNHHEKLDGSGYPRGLTSKDLSIESRIISVCDIYQALVEDRPYRKGFSKAKAFSILDEMVEKNYICNMAVNSLKQTLIKYNL